MEWLQAYKIGESMLNEGKRIEDAYLQNYRPRTFHNATSKGTRKAYVIKISASTLNESISVDKIPFDSNRMESDNFFNTISSNFKSYYLCTSYAKREGILNFFGVDNGNVKPDIKDKKPIGVLEILDVLTKSGLLSNEEKEKFDTSTLLKIRKNVREKPHLIRKLSIVVEKLPTLIEFSKKIATDFTDSVFTEAEQTAFREIGKINISDKGEDDIAYVYLEVDGVLLCKDLFYQELCLKRLMLIGRLDNANGQEIACYFSGSESEQAYSVNFFRDKINLLKSSTNLLNSTPNLLGDSFLVSKKAFHALKLGARAIDENLRIKISEIKHYIIPEFTGSYQANKLRSDVRDRMELAFSLRDYEQTRKNLYRITAQQINAITLVGYISDGRSIEFVNLIRIPSPNHFNRLIDLLEESQQFSTYLTKYSFPIKQIYGLIPVSSDKTNKPDSLIFYKSIFENIALERHFLFENYKSLIKVYRYARPYEKAGKQLYGGTINITYRENAIFDRQISLATLRYQTLLNLTTKLNWYSPMQLPDYSEFPPKTKHVFSECRYIRPQMALFYLGKMIRRVSDAQSQKQKNARKPILDKVNYAGMKLPDIKWLFCEVIEKMKQYEVLGFYALEDIKHFKNQFDLAEAEGWALNEVENVFYLFSGYAMFWEVLEPKAKVEAKKQGIEDIDTAENLEDNSEEYEGDNGNDELTDEND